MILYIGLFGEDAAWKLDLILLMEGIFYIDYFLNLTELLQFLN